MASRVLETFCDALGIACPEVHDGDAEAERRRALWAAEVALRAASDGCERARAMAEAQILWRLPEVIDEASARAARAATRDGPSLCVGWASAAAGAASLRGDGAAVKAAGCAARAIRAVDPPDLERARDFVDDVALDDAARAAPARFRDEMAAAMISVDLGRAADAVQYRPGSEDERDSLQVAWRLLRGGLWPLSGAGVDASRQQLAVATRFVRVRARMLALPLPRHV
jgi:hypothetical protein